MTAARARKPLGVYQPKGNRPLALRPNIVHLHTHAFVPQTLDPVSCVRCNLPAINGRHRPTGVAA